MSTRRYFYYILGTHRKYNHANLSLCVWNHDNEELNIRPQQCSVHKELQWSCSHARWWLRVFCAIRLSNAWGCPRHDKAEKEKERERKRAEGEGERQRGSMRYSTSYTGRWEPQELSTDSQGSHEGDFRNQGGRVAGGNQWLDRVSDLLLTTDGKCRH